MSRRWFVRMLAIGAGLMLCLYTLLIISSLKDTKKVSSNNAQPEVSFNDRAYIEAEALRSADSYSRHAFNLDASNNLLSDRQLPDTRHPLCLKKKYDWGRKVPEVSVIISFHNEARSTLLRTVMSVLNRSPPDVLAEVVLVDDYSDDVQDGEQLTVLPKVWLIRNERREGLVRSRSKGASVARGEYLVFLDSHCEVNINWMEPLVENVLKNPKAVASPIIDIIDIDTFEYKPSSPNLKGGFDWGLRFKWLPLSAAEKAERTHPIQPIKSPVTPGGLFLIKKSWFDTLGGFDEGLEIWGAENCEISIKTWLCGGRVETIPCSRVGHVFRRRHPYIFPNGSAATYLFNSVRVAEVWMDEYKDYFYSNRPAARNVVTSLEDRKKLKSNLRCKHFKWYLENVYPELKAPNGEATAFGQLQQGEECLGMVGSNSDKVILTSCLYSRPSQDWSYSKSGQLQSNGKCLSVKYETIHNHRVIIEACNNKNLNQKWTRRRRLLVHKQTGLCLETQNQQEIVIGECRTHSYIQQWDFSMELQMWT